VRQEAGSKIKISKEAEELANTIIMNLYNDPEYKYLDKNKNSKIYKKQVENIKILVQTALDNNIDPETFVGVAGAESAFGVNVGKGNRRNTFQINKQGLEDMKNFLVNNGLVKEDEAKLLESVLANPNAEISDPVVAAKVGAIWMKYKAFNVFKDAGFSSKKFDNWNDYAQNMKTLWGKIDTELLKDKNSALLDLTVAEHRGGLTSEVMQKLITNPLKDYTAETLATTITSIKKEATITTLKDVKPKDHTGETLGEYLLKVATAITNHPKTDEIILNYKPKTSEEIQDIQKKQTEKTKELAKEIQKQALQQPTNKTKTNILESYTKDALANRILNDLDPDKQKVLKIMPGL
jgi:uncharacterized protein YdbL (DUF1318 family)